MPHATIHRPALVFTKILALGFVLVASGCAKDAGDGRPGSSGPAPAPLTSAEPTPAGPERTSDSGRRTLRPSAIGRLAPEQAPTVHGK